MIRISPCESGYEVKCKGVCLPLTQVELNSLHELLGKHVKEVELTPTDWIRQALEEGIRDREAAEQMLLGWNQNSRRFKS